MQVFLFAIDKRNRTHNSDIWRGTKKYPVYQLGVFEKSDNKFTEVNAFPIVGLLSNLNIRCVYNYEGTKYEILDGVDVELNFPNIGE